jgi:hypothetical protein
MTIQKSIRVLAIISAIGISAASIPTASFAQATKDSSKTEDVSKWTQKQWNAAKAKWMKEKDKWSSCNKQATNEKLSGRKSWSFIYTCMTK